MLEHKKLRVAVIGCGMIHVEHMQGYAELKDKVEIVAAVDRKSECLKEMHDRWGLPETALFADWKTMLAKVRPDAVDLCLPNYEHLPATLDAIAAGCHVYCEKPLGMNVAECEKMIAAAKAKNVKLAVGFQQEYCPSTEVLVNARNAGFFGDLRFVHGALLRRRGTPNWGTYYSRELGGGPVLDILVHLGRLRDGSRKVLSVTEIGGVENGEITFNNIFQFEEEGEKKKTVEGRLKKVGELKEQTKLRAAGYFL